MLSQGVGRFRERSSPGCRGLRGQLRRVHGRGLGCSVSRCRSQDAGVLAAQLPGMQGLGGAAPTGCRGAEGMLEDPQNKTEDVGDAFEPT